MIGQASSSPSYGSGSFSSYFTPFLNHVSGTTPHPGLPLPQDPTLVPAEIQDGSPDIILTTHRLLRPLTQKHHSNQPGRAGDLDFGLVPLRGAWPITYGTARVLSPFGLQVMIGSGAANPNSPVCRSLVAEAEAIDQRQTKTEVKEVRI
jgi:hypothetical protein